MAEVKGNQKYDLEERTFLFAKTVRTFLKDFPDDKLLFRDDALQLVRASASVGANYIEANESLSKKDFVFRIKICRKEAKECAFFLRLIVETIPELQQKGIVLQDEAIQLKKIFSAILEKSK